MPTLKNVANNVESLSLAAIYVPGSGTAVLNRPASYLKVAPPFRITVVTLATYGTFSEESTIFAVSVVADATPIVGQCTLTIEVDEGTTDRFYEVGDLVDMRPTAGAIMDLNAVANETTDIQIDQHQGVITVDSPSSGTVTCDWSISDKHSVTMVANTTFTFSNPAIGQICVLMIIQSGSGSYTPTLPSTVDFGTVGLPVWSTAVNAMDILVMIYDGIKYRAGVFGLGY